MKHAIPNDWDGESFCRFAICWPDTVQWRALLRGLITEPARGFFWDEKTGSIIGVLGQFRQTVDQNIELPEVFMACNDQNIADALQAIATALTSQNNSSNATAVAPCGGGGGSPVISNTAISIQTFVTLGDGTKWPVMGTQPVAELPPGGFPDGYTDEAEYDTDKCAKATKMADDFIASIENFATVNWVAGVVGAGAILACLVGLITVPYATIPLLLFALCGNIGITTALSAFADELQNRREDLICILYQGDTVEVIISLMSDLLDSVIAAIEVVGTLGFVLKNIALWLMNSDTLNVLFSSAAKQAYPEADCSSCDEEELTLRFQDENGEWQFIPGFVWGEEYSFTAPTQPNGFRYLNFRCYPEYQFPNWENSYCEVSAINASDTGHCNDSQTFSPGTYGPQSNDGSTVNFNFGCSDSYPMTITARFYLPEELMP